MCGNLVYVAVGLKIASRNVERKLGAIKHALEKADKGDIIAICGKGDEDYQEIKGVKHHFSDREAVEKLVKG